MDDEPDILEFLSYNFRKKRYIVSVANDGVAGIKKAKAELPDLIISDIMMPEMDGIDMCKEIRADENLKHTPFIFLTAVTDDYKFLYAMTCGADQFIEKPIKIDYLLQIVNLAIEEKALQL